MMVLLALVLSQTVQHTILQNSTFIGSYGSKFQHFRSQMDWLYSKWTKAYGQGDTKKAAALETVLKRLEPQLDRLRAQAKAEERLELLTATASQQERLKAQLAALESQSTSSPTIPPSVSPTDSPTQLTRHPTHQPTNRPTEMSTVRPFSSLLTPAPTTYVTYAPSPYAAFDPHRGICTVFGFKEGADVPFLLGGDYVLAGHIYGKVYYR